MMTSVEFFHQVQARGIPLQLSADGSEIEFAAGTFAWEGGFVGFDQTLRQHVNEVALLLAIHARYASLARCHEIAPHDRARDLAMLEGNGDREHLRRSLALLAATNDEAA